jgi:hypothetical protein
MVQFRTNPDGSVTEIPRTHCPNGPRAAAPERDGCDWPKPGAGKLVRAWHCLICETTIYDDRFSIRRG